MACHTNQSCFLSVLCLVSMVSSGKNEILFLFLTFNFKVQFTNTKSFLLKHILHLYIQKKVKKTRLKNYVIV